MIITKRIIQNEFNDLSSLFSKLEMLINKYPEIKDYHTDITENKNKYRIPKPPEINLNLIDDLIALNNKTNLFDFSEDCFEYKIEFNSTLTIYKSKKCYSFPIVEFYTYKEKLLNIFKPSSLDYLENKNNPKTKPITIKNSNTKLNNIIDSFYHLFFTEDQLFKDKKDIIKIVDKQIEKENENLSNSFTPNLINHFNVNLTQLIELKKEVLNTNYEFQNKRMIVDRFFEQYELDTNYYYFKTELYDSLVKYNLLNFDFNIININFVCELLILISQNKDKSYETILSEKQDKLEKLKNEFINQFQYKKKDNVVDLSNYHYSKKEVCYYGFVGIKLPVNNDEKRQVNHFIHEKERMEKEIKLLTEYKNFININLNIN